DQPRTVHSGQTDRGVPHRAERAPAAAAGTGTRPAAGRGRRAAVRRTAVTARPARPGRGGGRAAHRRVRGAAAGPGAGDRARPRHVRDVPGAAVPRRAGCCGTRRGALADSGYWSRLRTRLDGVAGSPDGAQLAAAGAAIVRRHAAVRLDYGAWHGDWSPWNMASLDDTLLVWDWERFTPGVPIGLDALHHDLQRRLMAQPDARAAVEQTLDAAARLLLPFGVVHPAATTGTALLYLLHL